MSSHVCRLGSSLSYQTSPKAPIPTGCKSVYLIPASAREEGAICQINKPARDLKGGAEDLGAHELCHLDWIDCSVTIRRWRGSIRGQGAQVYVCICVGRGFGIMDKIHIRCLEKRDLRIRATDDVPC